MAAKVGGNGVQGVGHGVERSLRKSFVEMRANQLSVGFRCPAQRGGAVGQ